MPTSTVPVDKIELRIGDTVRSLAEMDAAACDVRALRAVLHTAAGDAGVTALSGQVAHIERDDDGGLCRARVVQDGTAVDVTARHVVVATGATGRGAIPACTAEEAMGVVCAQRQRGLQLDGSAVLLLDTPSATRRDERPTCIWAVPGPGGVTTIGAAKTGDPRTLGPPDLMRHARLALTEMTTVARLPRPAGPIHAGRMNTGFSPRLLVKAPWLYVGDAAGVVNPFTGEGLSYAIQSALLAAESITAYPSDPAMARRAYAQRLDATFVGYFETARHAASRYHLTWRILAAAAGSDHPFSTKARRAIMLPTGLSALTADESIRLDRAEDALAGPFLLACDEISLTAIRNEWPFLARLATSTDHGTRQRLRPALLFLAAMLAVGSQPPPRYATVGAALELSSLGALAFLSPPPATVLERGVDWALTATVLSGDFLLAQASRLIADSTPGLSWSFADWLGELAESRIALLAADSTGRGTAASNTTAFFEMLFEFPVRIGAQLGGARPETITAVRDFGRYCGQAFLHADDILALGGRRTRLDTTIEVMLRSRISAVPGHLCTTWASAERLIGDSKIRAAAMKASIGECRQATGLALELLPTIPNPAARAIFRRFITTLAAPAESANREGPVSPQCGEPS